jgi:hypothetical protein
MSPVQRLGAAYFEHMGEADRMADELAAKQAEYEAGKDRTCALTSGNDDGKVGSESK